jgi:hypothetical protein
VGASEPAEGGTVMNDVLRKRLMRKLESLPEVQLYQALDFIEFLESRYAPGGVLAEESSGLQRFAENLEDRLRRKAVSPATLREAFQLIASADRVLSDVANAGRQLLGDLTVDPALSPRPGAAPGSDGTRGGSTELREGSPGKGGDPPDPRG